MRREFKLNVRKVLRVLVFIQANLGQAYYPICEVHGVLANDHAEDCNVRDQYIAKVIGKLPDCEICAAEAKVLCSEQCAIYVALILVKAMGFVKLNSKRSSDWHVQTRGMRTEHQLWAK